jgi:hypothetical protein
MITFLMRYCSRPSTFLTLIMKRLIFIFIVFGFQDGCGQNTPWTLGIKANAGQSGVSKTEVRDIEIRDKFKPEVTFGFGVRGGYIFSKLFTTTIDLEWQHMGDKRVRIMDFDAVGIGRVVNQTGFINRFQRVQIPVSLVFTPFSCKLSPFAKVGFMPNFILNGTFEETFTSNQSNATAFTESEIDFEISPNKKLQKQTHFFAGAGIRIGKHWSVEAVHYFAKKLEYVTGYSEQEFKLFPTHYSHALQGTQFSLVYHIW